MGTFIINGGQSLAGELFPQGAKNEALQIICATLLTPEKVIINNIPDILDVNHLIELVEKLGCRVEKTGEKKQSNKRAGSTPKPAWERDPVLFRLVSALS